MSFGKRLFESYAADFAGRVREVALLADGKADDIVDGLNEFADAVETLDFGDEDAFANIFNRVNSKKKDHTTQTINGFANGQRVVFVNTTTGKAKRGLVDFSVPTVFPDTVPVRMDDGEHDGYNGSHLMSEETYDTINKKEKSNG